MSIIVIGAHLDDNALSCGQLLAGSAEALSVSVLAGSPTDDRLTEYDRGRGFTTSADSIAARRVEDACASIVMGCEFRHLDLLDSQYGVPVSAEAVVHELVQALGESPEGEIVISAGIRHPDHVAVARAGIAYAKLLNRDVIWVAEDVPYRVENPELAASAVASAVDLWNASTWYLESPAHSADISVKRLAVQCYTSQLSALNLDSCFVGERIWRLQR